MCKHKRKPLLSYPARPLFGVVLLMEMQVMKQLGVAQTALRWRAAGVAVLAMIVVFVASNILVSMPINEWLTWGAFSFPLTYLVIDLCNRTLGPYWARRIAWLSLPFAALISWYFATGQIAVASAVAFVCGQLLDITVFNRLRQSSWWKAPWAGSMLGSVLDTVLFFSIAFYGTDTWMQLALGDLAVKWSMACVLLAPYRLLLPRLGVWQPAPVPAVVAA